MEIHLAPLENVSCWAFRKLCKGASDSYTGMLSLTNLVKRNNAWEKVDTFPIEGQKQWIQIATSKETECFAFLKKLEEEIKKYPEKDNIYGIQLNVSCPSPYLIKIGQGAALLKRPTKVGNLVKELLKQEKYKVGVKLRLGLNETEVKQRIILNLFKELEKITKDNSNFTNVTIHLKHAKESSSTDYNYSILNELVSYNLPLIINGGIKTFEDIKRLIESIAPENRKNIKGVMLGRAAMKNPDCFSEINRNFEGTPFVHRNKEEIKKEFNELCKQHMPQEIFLKTIEEKTEI
ncbi:tRNA-dihydrouridine synthase family protein [Candidatus Woesearchaeota archaeon]|nr:tRNA-dihydrouridine synthase family protein [Candidatus Woesearchaeota archaeon]